MNNASVRLTGLPGTPMLTHNERLANPLDPITKQLKAVTGKRKKTEEDHEKMSEIEFYGGLYLTDDGTVGVPTWNTLASIKAGAKLHKLGTTIDRAVVPMSADVVPIKHDGPNTPEAMYLTPGCVDKRGIKVGQQRVTRTRPAFTNWTVDVAFIVDTSLLNMDDFALCVRSAGELCGLGDYRPRFGRYTSEITWT